MSRRKNGGGVVDCIACNGKFDIDQAIPFTYPDVGMFPPYLRLVHGNRPHDSRTETVYMCLGCWAFEDLTCKPPDGAV